MHRGSPDVVPDLLGQSDINQKTDPGMRRNRTSDLRRLSNRSFSTQAHNRALAHCYVQNECDSKSGKYKSPVQKLSFINSPRKK